MIAAVYFTHEETCPPEKMVVLVRECEAKDTKLIMGCDANAHYTCWGSTDCNSRGESLLEFLAATNIDFLNTNSRPTFRNAVRKEVIDITLASRNVWSEVMDWRVSEEVSMSDHQHIVFRLGEQSTLDQLIRNFRKTNWVGYREELKAKVSFFPVTYGAAEDIDHYSRILRDIIISSYENNCVFRLKRPSKGAPW
ncbi:uncharacterized protein LOC103316162 [Nasonia vitripennis]|uniref:Endonuclease/exonuclease/phosphatase domain-containing protein n=1 Tax=Nasonia vitripennis TaxID=7425 RepID=A0A7M7LUB9_NASVI|nr:uncharacterized protein LOC103316162 [Nasonia vitripennis]